MLDIRVHPRTGEPLSPVGFRRDGRPIWPILGASEDNGDPNGTSGTDSGDGGEGGSGEGGGQQKPADQTGEGGQDTQSVSDLPAWAQKKIRDLRKEAADNRGAATTAKTEAQKQLDAVAVALGLKKGEDLDPAKLATDLSAAQESERGTRIELAVFRIAGKAGADADALLDSRGFMASLKDLDPSAKDFTDKVKAAIKAATDANPKLKADTAGAGGAKRSGGDLGGGPGNGTGKRPTSLGAAVSKHFGA